MAFPHRAPFVVNALPLGFLSGFRGEYGYLETQYQNLNPLVGMLDNDFRNPNLNRFVDHFFEHKPQVDVIADVDDDTERSKREVEAETVAYVVGRYCEFDTSGSAFYLAASSSDDADDVRNRLSRISQTAEEIIEVLENELSISTPTSC